MKTTIPKEWIPSTYKAAIAEGFRVCEENFTGNLKRSGFLKLERINKQTGDREVMTVPFTAKLKVKIPTAHRIERHSRLTPNEAKEFETSIRKTVSQSESTTPEQNAPTNSPGAIETLVGTNPIDEARQNGIPLPVLLKASIAAASEKRTRKKLPKTKREKPQTFELADAFDYFVIADGEEPSTSQFNNERCIRSVAFLLQYCSEHGNENVPGFIAHGLSFVLDKCASQVRRPDEHGRWQREAFAHLE